MFDNPEIKGLRQEINFLGEQITQIKELIENHHAYLVEKLEAIEGKIERELEEHEAKVTKLEDENYGEDDELYDEAKKVVIQAGKASTSYLQRKLGIGYARAAKLMDMMDDEGILGAEHGSRPRNVIVEPEEGGEKTA